MSRVSAEKNREYQRAWYAKNKEKQKARTRKYRFVLKDKVSEYKASHPCVDCGEMYPSCVMDFDHTGEDKSANVSFLASGNYSKKVWEEIEKCELVCSNCHRIRTHNRDHTHR